MYPNKESGLGAKMATALFDNAMFSNPTTGRVFIVAKAALANASEISAIYGNNYPDGTPVIFTTIALAKAQCVAGRGDLILVAPGHTESITSATALTMSISGVNVVGCGAGSQRPVITLDTANTATINVTAAGVAFKNCVFVANFLNVASLFTLTTAADFQVIGCEIRDTSTVLNFVAIVTTAATSNAADGLVLDNNKFFLLIATGATLLVSAVGTNDRWTISNNYYTTPTTGTGAVIPIATGKILTNLRMFKNIFNLVQTTGVTTGILITTDGSTNTGAIYDNYIKGLDATTEILVTASSGFVFFNNFYSGAADKSGYLLPAADA